MRRIAGRKAAWVAMLALAVVPLEIAACGGDDDDSGGGGGGEGKKVGLLMDVLRNDKSFGQATYMGMKRAAKDFGLELRVVDNLGSNPKKAASTLQNMAKENDMLVNGAVATMGQIPRIAQQYPDKQFSVYAVAIPTRENLHYAYQDWYPLGYQAGAIAANATKTKVVGFVGGGEIPPTIAAQQAYKKAIREVDPNIKVVSVITGDFNDAAKGKDSTAAQIAQKADVIYSFLDAGHEGAVDAVKESGRDVKLMSVILPKCDFSQGFELGDSIARQDQLAYELVRNMVEGKSKDVVYGIQNPKVAGFQFCPGEGSTQLESTASDVRKRFTDGELKTPPELRQAQGETG